MYVCANVYACVCAGHTCVRVCVRVCVRESARVRVRLHVRALVGARVGACGCGRACGHVHLRARVSQCACVHAHACVPEGKGCGAHVRSRVSRRVRACSFVRSYAI